MKFFDIVKQHLAMVRMEDDYVALPSDSLTLLGNLLNGNFSEFYSYHGTVLFPVCVVDVMWFDFLSPIEIGVDFVRLALVRSIVFLNLYLMVFKGETNGVLGK